LRTFENALSAADSRLLVIGYGFRDKHVNEVLERAIAKGLRLFVIDPNGAELAFKLNRTRSGGIAASTALEAMLR
jgi:phosphatidylserine/phosphatidylglycerophosphate/cardiolipin synthase-like enzyme